MFDIVILFNTVGIVQHYLWRWQLQHNEDGHNFTATAAVCGNVYCLIN